MALLIPILDIFVYVVIAEALLSWVMPPDKFPRSVLSKVMRPLYAPIRMILPPEKMGGFDLSPLVLIAAAQFLKQAVRGH